jgi:hypothetical protein
MNIKAQYFLINMNMNLFSIFLFFFLHAFQIMAHSSLEATSETCSNRVDVKEGHLHMTSLTESNQQQECLIKLHRGSSVFLELERYSGRDYDKNAWTNITAVGRPNVTISMNDNFILVGDKRIDVLTHSKLEKSMWVRITFLNKHLEFHFAPIAGSSDAAVDFGHLTTAEHLTDGYALISSSTSSGMEQVLRSIRTTLPKIEPKISLKTVHEIERRIKEVELELKKSVRITEEMIGAQTIVLEEYENQILAIVNKADGGKNDLLFSMVPYICGVLFVILFLFLLYWKCKAKRRFRLD